MDKVHLRVPSSTSNLGPGFDTLGLALPWYLDVFAQIKGEGVNIFLDFDGPDSWEGPLKNMIKEALSAWENKSGKKLDNMSLSLSGDLALARGFGSSAVYRVAAIASANMLMGGPLEKDEVLALVCGLENHSDNAVPCMYGGLTISGWDGEKVRYFKRAVPKRFRFAAIVPEMELATKKARGVLSETVKREDAVFNMQRALFLVEAITQDRPELLESAFQDRLHQPYREKLLPFLKDVIEAAEEKGAYGAFLSGAGSSIIAVTDEKNAPLVAEEMKKVLLLHGKQGKCKIMEADNEGTVIIK